MRSPLFFFVKKEKALDIAFYKWYNKAIIYGGVL